jgi:uncharacterized protein (TIGR00255 family)
MTGFGSARRRWATPDGPVFLHVEVRSVNGRFLEIKLRQPFGGALDQQLRKRLSGRLGRGRVELSIALRRAGGEEDSGGLAGLGVDAGTLATVVDAVREVAAAAEDKLELSPPTAVEILRFLQSLSRGGTGTEAPQSPPDFHDARVDEALAQLCSFRDKEGAALAAVLAGQLDVVEAHTAKLRAQLPASEAAVAERVTSRIDALTERLAAGGLDPDRVAQEAALVVARADVTEELDRIDSHLAQAREVLGATPAAGQGKTLEFVAQELFREITTIGSKIGSHDGSRIVIEAKGTIERIREQVSNVE